MIEPLLDAIARRGRTEREKNPTILLASHYRRQRIAACLFAGFQIGFSCAAHIVARPTRSDNKAVCKDAVCSWYRLNVDNGKCHDNPINRATCEVGAAHPHAQKNQPRP